MILIEQTGSSRDLRRVLRISAPTATRYLQNGAIKGAYKIGGRWHIPMDTLRRLADGLFPGQDV